MRSWLPFERRRLAILLAASLPPDPGAGLPGFSDAHARDLEAELTRSAPLLVRFGLRIAVWVLWLAPPWLGAGWRSFGRLDADGRDLVLQRAAGHRSYLLRQLVTTLKIMACFAWFRDPVCRAPFREPGT